jgi:protein TonB
LYLCLAAIPPYDRAENPVFAACALTQQTPSSSAATEVVMVARTSQGLPYGAMGRIVVVAGMHVAALYLIAMSLGIAPPLQIVKTELINVPEPVVPDDPLPVVRPDVPRPDIPQLPMPDVPIPIDDPAPTITAELVPTSELPAESQPGSAIPVPAISPPAIDPRRPLSRPPYPPEVIRLNGQGSAIVEIYVMENGRVGDARIVKSSGFEALDRATLSEAKRNWRLKPGTRDGVPVAQWHRLTVAFRLEDR